MTSLADLIARAEVLALRPGDTLIVHLDDDRDLTPEHAHILTERMKAHMPDNKVVVIAAGKVLIETAPETSNHTAEAL